MIDERNKSFSCGESLAELLVASLIISLAMIMVFSATRVGTSVLAKSRDKYIEYYNACNEDEKKQAAYVKKYYELYPSTTTQPVGESFTITPRRVNN